MDDIEELSFTGMIKPGSPHNRRPNLWTRVLAITLALMMVGLGGWGYWMWDHRWRTVGIQVDGKRVSTQAGTTVTTLLTAHHSFGHRRGRLLAVNNAVINGHGGAPVRVSMNGTAAVPNDLLSHRALSEGDVLTISSGLDVTEPHSVEHKPIPFKDDINIRGAAIQMVKQHGRNGEREVWIGRMSHNKAQRRVISKPQDLKVTALNPRPTGAKVIALTFDDGPSRFTGPILDILKSKGVKATFFDIGQSSRVFPDAEKRVAREGNQVASHSNTHPDLTKLNGDQAHTEVKAGLESLRAASGATTRTFRAPYGAFGARQWRQVSDLIDYNVLWDIDTLDWKRPGPDVIHDNVLHNAHNGAIVLMHDGGGDRSQDVAALPRIIDDLRAQGYGFVTIQQLIAMA